MAAKETDVEEVDIDALLEERFLRIALSSTQTVLERYKQLQKMNPPTLKRMKTIEGVVQALEILVMGR